MEKQYGLLFPGQGSQKVGMGFPLADRFDDFRDIFTKTLAEADAALGFSLSEVIKEGPAEKLKETEITQPALLTVSTAMGRWLKERNIGTRVCLGHSLGEYSALVHAEAIAFQEAVKIVNLRGRLMAEEVPSGKGGMAALIGADPDSAATLCKAVSEGDCLIEPSVFNSPGQIVISGCQEGIQEARKRAKEFGIRLVTPLEVSGPFHCSLLKGAGEKLRPTLEKADIRPPKFPVIANLTAGPESDPDEIRENLVAQVSKPVLWADSLRHVDDESKEIEFVEVGSGKVLTGILRKVLPDAKCISLEGIERIEVLTD